jgi:hypothetical protein
MTLNFHQTNIEKVFFYFIYNNVVQNSKNKIAKTKSHFETNIPKTN